MFVHELVADQGENGDAHGVHVVLHSRHCICDIGHETSSFEPPIELGAIFAPGGKCNFMRVETREARRMKNPARSSIVECMATAAMHEMHVIEEPNGDPTNPVMVRQPKMIPASYNELVLQAAYVAREVRDTSAPCLRADDIGLSVPPGIAASVLYTPKGCVLFTGVHGSFSRVDGKYVKRHDVDDDPLNSNNPRAVFNAWVADLEISLIEIPGPDWMKYYIENQQQVPTTNYWRVYHRDICQNVVVMKQGPVIKSTTFYDLLIRVCVLSKLTQDDFLETLETHLLGIAHQLADSDLSQMVTTWTRAGMLTVRQPMHGQFVRVYQRVYQAARSFLEHRQWPPATNRYRKKPANIATALQKLLISVSAPKPVPPPPPARPRAACIEPPAPSSALVSQRLDQIRVSQKSISQKLDRIMTMLEDRV